MNLQETLGVTFLVVTHDQEEAMTMADRISVMNHGHIVQVATPAEIYEAPNSSYVADFVGSVNLFEARVESASPGGVRLAATDGFAVEAAGSASVTAGQTAFFAIRPEKVRIGHDAPAEPGINAIAGEVWDIGYLGDMTTYNVRLASGKVVRASRLNAVRSIERPIAWEDRVWLSWAADAGIVLDR